MQSDQQMARVQEWLKQWWPCLVSLTFLWGAVTAILVVSLRMNEGHLVYALDDSYIHMAIAKNLARHGVWGITPYQFSATSSSPLWTLLVAAVYRVFGPNTATPLVLNLLFTSLLVFAVRWILVSLFPGLPGLYTLGVLLCVLCFSPVLNLIFLGMEHSLHILLTLLFVFEAVKILASTSPPSRASRWTLILLGVLTSAARYEGLFAVAVVAVFLFLRRRRRLSVEVAFWSVMPAFILGAISVREGWFWLPNPVALKGNLPLGSENVGARFAGHVIENTLYSGMRVVRLMGVAALLLLWRAVEFKAGGAEPAATKDRVSSSIQAWMMGIFLPVAALHLTLANTGWFLRYEAYLVALGLVVVAAPLWDFARTLPPLRPFRRAMGIGLAAVVVLGVSAGQFWTSCYDSLHVTLPAMHDTYRCHYQMGSFVKRYYEGRSLAVNDIGVVDFLADIHLTDPHGLADRDIARARMEAGGMLDPEFLDRLARSRGVEVALVDEDWVEFSGGAFHRCTPRTWLLAGVWEFPHRIVLAPAGQAFYALDEAARMELIRNLRQYGQTLPPNVKQAGPYSRVSTSGSGQTVLR